jgi:hypothetical protein
LFKFPVEKKMVIAENLRPVSEDVRLGVDLVEAGPEKTTRVRARQVVHAKQGVHACDHVYIGKH